MAFITELDFDPDSWPSNTDLDKFLSENSDIAFQVLNSEINEIFTQTQMGTSSTPSSKKRLFSAHSSEMSEVGRKKMKGESVLSKTSAGIDMLGVNLFKPNQYGQCTQKELERYRIATDLEKSETWIN